MDIDLLAKMVRELILDNDAVTLPGVGSFVADLVPSVFSDKGYTIHPPYRRLYFTPREGADTLLADLYAQSNNLDRDTATRILVEFLAAMKEELKTRKTIVFPSLGRLRATRENHFFFVADEDLDIYPAGFGLAPISLKTHVETPDEVASAVAGLAQQLQDPVPTEVELQFVDDDKEDAPAPVETAPAPVDEPAPVEEPITDVPVEEPAPVEEPLIEEPVEGPVIEEPIVEEPVEAPVETPVDEPLVDAPVDEPADPAPLKAPVPPRPVQHHHHHHHRPKKRTSAGKVILIVLGILVGLAILAAIALAVVGRLAPDWVDQLLYSAEELEIIRY